LQRWEHAQAARFNAWAEASTVSAGVTGVLATAGSMFKGAGRRAPTFVAGLSTPTSQVGGYGSITRGVSPVRSFAAAARWAAGPSSGLSYK
ncbi:MAG: hypothetical protein ACREDE_09205, partial [Thermoplasmata archaeon]